jgi:hypothetical protein
MIRRAFDSGVKLLARSVPAVAMVAANLSARAPGGRRKVNRTKEGVGIVGYDPVAYFDGAPAVGKADIELVYQGTKYRFARDPARFVPQYGGCCAWAVSRGYTATIDPLARKIVANKLYLNYSIAVQKMWEREVKGNIEKGDANWPNIR